MKTNTWLALLLPLVAMSHNSALAGEVANLVFVDGNVVTMDANRSLAKAVAVRGNQIVAVGTNADMEPFIDKTTKVIHLNGKTLMPGFIDAQIHPVAGGLELGKCNAEGLVQPVAALTAKVWKECLPREIGASPTKWIEVDNVNPANFVATWADLDKISNKRPVILEASDGHRVWLNSVALRLTKITDSTPDEGDGHIERDAKGHATGFLTGSAQGYALSAMPKLPLAQRVVLTGKALDLLHAKGITSLQDSSVGQDELDVFEALEKSSQLHTRVRAGLKSAITTDEAEFQRLATVRAHFAGHRLVRADAVNIVADGVVAFPNQTAAMIDPYLDESGNPTANFGRRYFKEDVFNSYVQKLDKDGFTVVVYSAGDYTARVALNAFDQARTANGANNNRHQITHLQFIGAADLPRLAKLNIFAAMPLSAAVPDEVMSDAIKPFFTVDHFAHVYPASSLNKAGTTIVGLSDWPSGAVVVDAASSTPLAAMQAGLTRSNQNPASKFYGQSLHTDEALDLDTVLAAYTIHAAKALKQDDKTGSIEVGKLADLVVLGRNPLTTPANKLSEIPVQTTVFDGAIVYQFKPAGT